jgi:large subunit ribosomal protein L25
MDISDRGKQMAKEAIKIQAEARTEQGSAAAGRLRRAGSVPGAVNRIEGGTTLVKLNGQTLSILLRRQASEHVLVTLELDGKEVPALIREVQYDVMTGAPIHADFGEISLTKKLRISIPLYLLGEPEGVKLDGGILQHNLRTIEVDCLPTDIVEHFEVDVSALKLSQSLFVRDLKLGDKFTVITGKDVPVATVVEAAEEEAVAAPAEGAAATGDAAAAGGTPEVIAKGKKEEGDAAAAPAAGAAGAKAPAGKAPAAAKAPAKK